MPGPIRTRLACDRCHSQKLRCPKEPGSSVCTRCARAGAICTFSPPGRHFLHQDELAAPVSTGDVNPPAAGEPPDLAVDDLQFDWPFMYDGLSLDALVQLPTPNSLENAPLDGVEQARNGSAWMGGSDGPTAAMNVAEGQNASCSQRLSRLVAEADAILAWIPQEADFHTSRGDSLPQHSVEFAHRFSGKDFIERIFGALQRLIDIYPDAVTAALPSRRDSNPLCDIVDCVHLDKVPSPLVPLSERLEELQRRPRIDLATGNLLISCHIRFLDVFDRILGGSLACFRMALASPTLEEPDFPLPDLKIGSFVPPKASSVVMQMALLNHLLSALGQRLGQFSKALDGVPEGHTKREIRSLTLQCELLTERQDGTLQELESIKPALIQLGMMKGFPS